jgi:hypothetical protein
MTGMNMYRRFKQVEAAANKLGFAFGDDPYGRPNDSITLVPMADENVLPVYNRKASFFTGDINQVAAFLAGIGWAREYDIALGYKLHKTRAKAEARAIEELRVRQEKRDAANVMRILKGEAPIKDPKDDPPF